MNRPASAIEAISPAVQRVRTILFRPFDPTRWLILGFLTFLTLLGGGGGYGGINFNFPFGRNGDGSHVTLDELRDWTQWITEHVIGIVVVGFFIVLIVLTVIVVFLWLSSRATFCYLDCVAKNRAEVVRPWKQNAEQADSYFFWRLVFSLVTLVTMAALLVPIVVSLWLWVNSGQSIGLLRFLFKGGLADVAGPALAVLVFASIIIFIWAVFAILIIQVLLVDFVVPVQYLRRVRCAEAFRIVIQLARANMGAFVLYFIVRLVISVVLHFCLTLIGCMTCCVAFCCWAIPVIGQMILQPVYVFTRSISLYFLRQFGPQFDVFGPEAPAGGPGGGPESPPRTDPGVAGSTPALPPAGPVSPPFDPGTPGPAGPGLMRQGAVATPGPPFHVVVLQGAVAS